MESPTRYKFQKLHIDANPPNLVIQTIADSIANMPNPLFKAGDIVIIPSARFAVVLAAIPSPTFEWVYMVQTDNENYEYFTLENLIEYK